MELKFKRDTSFRKQFFTAESFAHPAKMDAHLLLWIVECYTKPGEVILDPMAGMGTTMLACTVGRNVVLVELEEKFCNMCKSNWEKVSAMPQLGYEMGQCNIVQGDARQLEGLLVDKIVTSPPFAGAKQRHDLEFLKKIAKDQSAKYLTGENKGHFASAEAIERYYEKQSVDSNRNNIANLPYGQIDKIVTSPPFGEAQEGSGLAKNPPASFRGVLKNFTQKQGDDIRNVSNLPYGNIDSIITSSPYENQVSPSMGGAPLKPEGVKIGCDNIRQGYSESESQIGNLKSDSYLEAMLQVYQQCHKVLKPWVKRCACGIIEAEVEDGQTLSSGILRRRGLRDVVSKGGKNNLGAEDKGDIGANKGLLGESRLPERTHLSPEIQIHSTQRQKSRGIQVTGSQLSGHQDNSERPDAILNSEKGGSNQDTPGNRQEASPYGEAERGRRDDAEESGAVVNQDREVLPLLKQEDTVDFTQGGGIVTSKICPKCNQAIRYTGGLLILVTKNFIRNKQVVRLDEDTIKLCEQAGFSFVERHYRKLTSQSFWRIIYHRKYPGVEKIEHEDLLVFQCSKGER